MNRRVPLFERPIHRFEARTNAVSLVCKRAVQAEAELCEGSHEVYVRVGGLPRERRGGNERQQQARHQTPCHEAILHHHNQERIVFDDSFLVIVLPTPF